MTNLATLVCATGVAVGIAMVPTRSNAGRALATPPTSGPGGQVLRSSEFTGSSAVKDAPQTSAGKRPVDLKALYEAHDWFALRDAIQKAEAPALYRGAVEAAFNESGAAAKDLRKAITDSPKSEVAFEAHEMLAGIFFREAQCKEFMTQARAMALLRPDDHSEDAGRIFCGAVRNIDQTVVQDSGASSLLQMRDKYMLPVTINEKEGYYGFDSGSSVSTMSESEARRLGLVSKAAGTGGGAALRGVAIRAVVVPRLTIDHLTLSDVAFAVFSDKQEPFADLPEGQRGILGLPVLLAMKSFAWTRTGGFEIHPVSESGDLAQRNLCLDGVVPCVQVDCSGRQLTFGLDTGADSTTLYPKFAADFPALVKREGQKELHTGAGYDGTLTQSVIQLPEIVLVVGQFDAVVRPVRVLPRPLPNAAKEFYGNLGMDVLGEGSKVVVDFEHMTLTK